jgi:TctA family transporter
MWIGNLMLSYQPAAGAWVTLPGSVPAALSVHHRSAARGLLINNSPTDVVIAAMFGVIGLLIKHDFEGAPMLLGFVLGPLMEETSAAPC